ncbi:Probable E3 ubiquitin-protein ligase RHB1A [Linum perenne]
MGVFLSCFDAAKNSEINDRSSERFGCIPTFFKKFGKQNTRSTRTSRGSSATSNASYHAVRDKESRPTDPHSRGSASIKDNEEPKQVPKKPDSDADEDECPICLEVYDFENPKIYMQCMHYYHLSCAYEWMQRSATCPVCNKELLFED